jgi:hypothetical protein
MAANFECLLIANPCNISLLPTLNFLTPHGQSAFSNRNRNGMKTPGSGRIFKQIFHCFLRVFVPMRFYCFSVRFITLLL